MQEIQSLHPIQPTGLLGVPFEIRLEIYRYLLTRRELIELQPPIFYSDPWPNKDYPLNTKRYPVILLVSRQLSEEALNVLYGENVFEFSFSGSSLNIFSQFAPANRQRIRRLQLLACHGIPFYISLFDPDHHVLPPILESLAPILANLTRLYIVAQQPLRARTFDNASRLERGMRNWLTTLKPVLECVNQYVSSRATIEVDDNDMEETSELVKKCFPNGYRKVRTQTGDICFRRGVYWSDNPILTDPLWDDGCSD